MRVLTRNVQDKSYATPMYTALYEPWLCDSLRLFLSLMKLFLVCIALFIGQSQISQNEIIRPPAHTSKISLSDGGRTIELIDAAPIVYLPQNPPHMSFGGVPWYVDVRNLGPGTVTLRGNNNFAVHLLPNGTVHVRTVVTGYVTTER